MTDRPNNTQVELNQSKAFSRSKFVLWVALAIIVGFIAGTRSEMISGVSLFGDKATSDIDYREVQAVYEKLKTEYDGELDLEKLTEGASEGMVEAAGDPYTVYMTKEDSDDFKKNLDGDIGAGIGAEIGIRSGQPTVIRVLPDHPSEKAGMQNGDVIVGINDESAINLPLEKTVERLRGEEGSSVKVIVLRNKEPKEFSVVRQKIQNPSVSTRIENNVGIIRMSRFDEETGGLVRRASEDFVRKNVDGVILDLRDNGGGYVTAAQEVAGIWLDKKVVITEQRQGKVIDSLKSTGPKPTLATTPTVVLINGGSASASEIIAGALGEYGKAKIVGEKSFGKGTVQKMVELDNGGLLKVTIARWYTPKGKNITKEGIKPDKAIELTAQDADKGADPQIKAALELLKK